MKRLMAFFLNYTRAGLPQVYPQTCANEPPNNPSPPNPPRASPTCYPDNVPGPGSPRFDEAYFEISHIRAYTTGTSPPPSSVTSATQVASGGSTTTISTNGGVITVGPDIPNASSPNHASIPRGVDTIACVFAGMMGLTGVFIGGLLF